MARARKRESVAVETAQQDEICGLFDVVDIHVDDAAGLGSRAVAASMLATRQGRFAEGRHFAQLAEIYYRIAPHQQPDIMQLVLSAITEEGACDAMFSRSEDKHRNDPLRVEYWDWKAARQRKVREDAQEVQRLRHRVAELEAKLGVAQEAAEGTSAPASRS